MKRHRPRKWRNPYRRDLLWQSQLLKQWIRRMGAPDLDQQWTAAIREEPTTMLKPYSLDILVRGVTRTIQLPRVEPGNVGAAFEHLAHHTARGAIDEFVAVDVAQLLRALDEAKA